MNCSRVQVYYFHIVINSSIHLYIQPMLLHFSNQYNTTT